MLNRPLCWVIRRFASQHAYQKTLNLPHTRFANRSNLQRTVDELIPQSCDRVYKTQLQEFLQKIEEFGDDSDSKLKFVEENLFVLQDGPPYANGDLHYGHALNKILKDIINRYQLSQGKYVFYKPGWDCHGLPIELKALKQFNADQIGRVAPTKIRSMASNHARKAIKLQKEQFRKFAIMADWDRPYVTMESEYEINQLRVFLRMVSRGLIKRQNKPVYWGTETRTALAEGELEYNEKHSSRAAYVGFPLTRDSSAKLLESAHISSVADASLLIWTTTPWTLFSNRAVCFNEKFEYRLLRDTSNSGKYVVVESDLAERLEFLSSYQKMSVIPSSLLAQLQYTNPLLGDHTARPLLHGDHVTNSAGTGLVHTAPGHGFDDYNLAHQHKIEVISPVDAAGRYKLEELPSHLHKILIEPKTRLPRQVLEPSTTEVIIEMLQDLGMLFSSYEYIHSYPYDWRSKKPVIIRATPQWFADLHNVKEDAIQSLREVSFYPDRGNARLSSFIKNRNEWCISRQRSWGVPIPAFYKKDNPDVTLMTEETVEHVIKAIREKGIDAWFKPTDSDMVDWLPPRYRSEANSYYRGKDTMDVWFDSGTAWNELKDFYLKELKLKQLPTYLADVYLEGSDQHRGWFQSSTLTRVAYSGKPIAPFKNLITHGFTLDEKGIKMSKSIGNVISPNAIIQGDKNRGLPALGVDGLRYLVAQSNFTADVAAGPVIMNHVAEALKKFRLAFRFLLGNLQKSTFKRMPYDQLRPIDEYVLYKLQDLQHTARAFYNENNFSKVLTAVQYHMSNDLSALYFDISKDSLYSDALESLKRQQIQTVLLHILLSYTAIVGPILPTLVQEVCNALPVGWLDEREYQNLVIIKKWPSYDVPESAKDSFENLELKLLNEFQRQFATLEKSFTKSVQTVARIRSSGYLLPCSDDELADILRTARVEIINGGVPEDTETEISLSNGIKLHMLVRPSEMSKCPRCWKHNAPQNDTLCARCNDTIRSKA
ncbi:isoleucine-tRNA ligase [Zygosaccharomyces mellis]|uniref:Isoleucine--tRNA ligase, mitochondrial n=1 Tax=Zygosaccharomyces mellis TaxID=42258 RepID=A0A4C2E8M2_9SACH|nr:isoleucine-tRNA ligase [Zygosaccharomyces mellis]